MNDLSDNSNQPKEALSAVGPTPPLVNSPTLYNQTPSDFRPSIQSNTPKTPRKKSLIIVIAVSLFLLVAILAYVFIVKNKPQPSEPNESNSASTTNSIDATNINTASIEEAYDSFSQKGIKEFSVDKKEDTIEAYKKLLTGFDVGAEFYSETHNLIVGLGIARLYVDDLSNFENYRNELYLATAQHIKSIPAGITDEYFQAPESDDKVRSVFEKYKNSELTSRMESALSSSRLENEMKINLKFSSPDDLKTYTSIVLDFDASSSRQKRFAEEHYMFGAEPKMWVEKVQNETFILFTRDYASEFIGDINGNVRSSILHELIHAQNNYNVGHLGRTIEERRAEKFSGDKSAYYDAKQLFIYTEIFSGSSLDKLLENYPADPASFYLSMYASLGIKGANSIVASWPTAYLGNPATAISKVIEMSGNLNGAIEESLKIGGSNKSAQNDRMRIRYEKLISVFKTKNKVLDDIENNLSKNYSMPTAAGKMKEFINTNY